MSWYLLIVTLPTDATALRMRLWRNLKTLGAAVLRDGVYLLPNHAPHLETLHTLVDEVNAVPEGSAFQLDVTGGTTERFAALFDRSDQYRTLLHDIQQESEAVRLALLPQVDKQVKKLHKAFVALKAIDYFPASEVRDQVENALRELDVAIRRRLFPDEPTQTPGELSVLERHAYQGCTWATRQRPWVDRLASAWLIRRFIDSDAKMLWLASPTDCPTHALSFDFDGATFSHVGNKVTFETLLTRFQLDDAPLKRLASIVHYLDVGGIEPVEAAGIEQVLAGLRDTLTDDDQLLLSACTIFDGLFAHYQKEKDTPPHA